MPAPPTIADTNYHRAPPQPPSQAPPPAPLQGPPPRERCTPPPHERCTPPPHEVTYFFSLANKQHFHFYLFTEGQFWYFKTLWRCPKKSWRCRKKLSAESCYDSGRGVLIGEKMKKE